MHCDVEVLNKYTNTKLKKSPNTAHCVYFLLRRWENVITDDPKAVNSPDLVVKVWYFDYRNFAIASNALQLI